MRSYYALEPAQLAVFYVQHKGGPRYLPVTATRLHADVQDWLRRAGLDHRLAEAAEIAMQAYEIAQQVHAQAAPIPSEDQAAFQANVQTGTTADDSALDEMSRMGTSVARQNANALFRQ